MFRVWLTRMLMELLEADIRRMIREEIPPDGPELDYEMQPLFHEGKPKRATE